MRVGFVGLGTMGRPMARRILAADHELVCSSRSPAAVRELVAEGARAAGGPAEVVASSEITVLCLPDDEAVATVVAEAVPAVSGRLLVDCSTVAPETERRLHELVRSAGGRYLDAPISGGPAGAAAGTLAVMAGGEAGALDRARPALAAFAAEVTHVGGPGAGQVVKLCNQLVVAGQMLGLCEAVLLAERSGVDPAAVHRVLVHSTGDCTMARTRFPVPGVVPTSPASNGWRPDFTTRLMAKDLDLALAHAGGTSTPLLVAPILRALLGASAHAGFESADWSAFVNVLREDGKERLPS
jgi:3-hydroxyisobutyrate dehydrogenase